MQLQARYLCSFEVMRAPNEKLNVRNFVWLRSASSIGWSAQSQFALIQASNAVGHEMVANETPVLRFPRLLCETT
jgi:hypothetical protein